MRPIALAGGCAALLLFLLPASGIAVGTPTTVSSTTLSGGGQTGPSITVFQGTGVTDQATIAGPNAASAGGTVSFSMFSDPACTMFFAGEGSAPVAIWAGRTVVVADWTIPGFLPPMFPTCAPARSAGDRRLVARD